MESDDSALILYGKMIINQDQNFRALPHIEKTRVRNQPDVWVKNSVKASVNFQRAGDVLFDQSERRISEVAGANRFFS